MGRASEVLIPTRFLLTVGHFVVTILAIFSRTANVAAGLPSSAAASDVDAATNSVLAALALSLICFAVQFVGIFGGYTLFFDRLNLFHAVLHFVGGVLVAWYVVDIWVWTSIWWIFVLFSLVPAVAEGVALTGVLCRRVRY